jgi:HD-GYP domain-containing protein (c-di-GMP phosphodiesterase class II)
MTFSLTPEDVAKSTATKKRPYVIGLGILLAFGLAGIALIIDYAFSERKHAQALVEHNISEIAAARAADVAIWTATEQAQINKFANDEDVRLNFSEIQEPSANLDLAARDYLRNWLDNLAEKNGYSPKASSVEANVENKDATSIALVSLKGEEVLALGHPPLEDPGVKEAIAAGSKKIIGLFKGADERVYIALTAPIEAVSVAGSSRIGQLIAVKPADDLYSRLQQPGGVYQTGQVLLLTKAGEAAQIISPLPQEQPLSIMVQNGVEVSAVNGPGGIATGANYMGKRVLSASRSVEGTSWTLAFQVAEQEVMGNADQRLVYQLITFAGLLAIVLLFIIVAWRNGAARVAMEKALEYAALARKFEFQGKLLRLVTDSQRNNILIADTEGKVRFSNATMARSLEVSGEDLIGKPLAAAVGPDAARRLTKRAQEATISGKAVITVDRIELENDNYRVVQTQHIPLEDNSAGENNTPARGTLIVEEDITDVVVEREKRERILKQVVQSLVAMVDRRDPYAAEHSIRVAQAARAIAVEMDLSDIDADAIEMAGALMNLGKLLVPADLLTKHGQLDESELRVVRDSIIASADVVAGIEFEGPVVSTLRQCLERVDGAGYPDGLKGDDILLTARIVSVANAFVALISSRAHRKGLSLDAAIKILMEQSDTSYDRGVVAALVSYLDNKGGREAWAAPKEPVSQIDESNPWQR